MDSIYTEILLDRNLHPQYKDLQIDDAMEFLVVNSSCGDSFTIKLKVIDNIITSASFSGVGCAISQASTDMMLEFLIGKNINIAKEIVHDFRDLIKTGNIHDSLGDLNEFCNISKMPARVKCAELPWTFTEQLN